MTYVTILARVVLAAVVIEAAILACGDEPVPPDAQPLCLVEPGDEKATTCITCGGREVCESYPKCRECLPVDVWDNRCRLWGEWFECRVACSELPEPMCG